MSSLDLIPPNLNNRSIDNKEIALPMQEALEAIDALEKRGVRILAWEGWITSRDGSVGHVRASQGTVSLEGLSVGEAAQLCRKMIFEDGERWIRDDSNSSDELYSRVICQVSPRETIESDSANVKYAEQSREEADRRA